MELACDVLVVGGGCGGLAAALAASDLGRQVVLTEAGSWLGGQLTSQAVPPDEHPWGGAHWYNGPIPAAA
jgi:NADPH-dependent 2,4-dienoyl-CoA reductase/sulfur reductase-like enzyme